MEAVGTELAKYGLPGIVILGLGAAVVSLAAAVVVLWRQNQGLQKQLYQNAVEDKERAEASRDQVTTTMAITARALKMVGSKVKSTQRGSR